MKSLYCIFDFTRTIVVNSMLFAALHQVNSDALGRSFASAAAMAATATEKFDATPNDGNRMSANRANITNFFLWVFLEQNKTKNTVSISGREMWDLYGQHLKDYHIRLPLTDCGQVSKVIEQIVTFYEKEYSIELMTTQKIGGGIVHKTFNVKALIDVRNHF